MSGEELENSIAIIGMSARFPGADNISEYWSNIREGRESSTQLTDEMLRQVGVDEQRIADPHYVKTAFGIKEVDLFDYTFFDMNKREADMLDPQHRFLLMCAYEALEDGGYVADCYQGIISLFAGCGFNSYLFHEIMAQQKEVAEEDLQLLLQTNSSDYLCTRISYKLNLRGISVNIQSACSTSMVAVHQACQNLLMYQSDMALAGGASLRLPAGEGYLYQEGGIFSPDGHCRAFDADAKGTVFGSGVGVVLLKRLEDALTDHDHIYAVIRGSAVNNDGSAKVGYTAPSIQGQQDVIAEALMMAGISPNTIGYVEAHGTGTPLGDPIEIAALEEAFGAMESQSCAIGSVKTNIGHLNAASGIAGLIKAVCMLKYGEIPPSLNFHVPNPAIDFAASPFYVNTKLRKWERGAAPRRAGVSSFGIGGTNAHLILEEAPAPERDQPPFALEQPEAGQEQVILVSARTSAASVQLAHSLECFFSEHPEADKAAAAFTLQTGRTQFAYRRAAMFDLQGNLQPVAERKASVPGPGVIFMFPGQGSQYPGLAAGLYSTVPSFRKYMEECLSLLGGQDREIFKVLLLDKNEQGSAAEEVQRTAVAQPLIFMVEYALAKSLMEWGVKPVAMIGHSLGEYTAACVSGVISLEETLTLIMERGTLMEQTAAGGMMAVFSSWEEIQPLLEDELSLSAVNSASSCTVAGRKEALLRLAARLKGLEIEHRFLDVNHGFHSALMEPVLERFSEAVTRCSWRTPTIPFISNVTGEFITDRQVQDTDYWLGHLRNPVQFAKGVDTLLRGESCLWLEVGPGKALGQFVQQQSDGSHPSGVYNLLRRRDEARSDREVLLKGLAQCWVAGIDIRWEQLHEPGTGRISLPTYPFEGKRCWFRDSQDVKEETNDKSDWSGELRAHLSTGYVAPENGIQEKLVRIWQQVLGTQPIGIRDDFFELGGHSLLATQLISRLRNLFPNIQLQYDQLFAYTTIQEIAEQIELQMIEFLENQY